MDFLKGHAKLSTVLLGAIALFDLISTFMLMGRGFVEGNAAFARIFEDHGPIGFAIAKLFFVLIPIVIIEFARTRKPRTAEFGAWVAIIGYLALYLRHIFISFY